MKQLLPLLLWVLAAMSAGAQIVTTTPSPLQADSRDIVVTFHASEGNRGLAGLPASAEVYAHTGVITNRSTSATDWQYAPAWLDNAPKYKLTYAGPDTWKLTIGDIRKYYGITDPSVVVEKLMFVFRNANGSREGKTATGGDISVDVLPAGLQVTLTAGNTSVFGIADGTPVALSATTTAPADITLTIDGKSVASGSNTTQLNYDYTAERGRGVRVIATAKSGTTTVADTMTVTALNATATSAFPAGAVVPGLSEDGDSYLFAIAAPGKKSMMLVGSWNGFAISPSQQMARATESVTIPSDTAFIKNAYTLAQPYFWVSVPKAVAGNDFTYFYIADGSTAAGDPYARLIVDPDNDRYIPSSVFPGLPDYPAALPVRNIPLAWHTTRFDATKGKEFAIPQHNGLTIYELLLRDFTSDAAGTLASGTIESAIGRLDYIASLGVDAIELMPVMEFGGNNSWGYNPNFYFAPDKAYGTPDDYHRLIEEAHSRGLAVILDVVFNQADSSHPWWMMYSAADNPFFNATAPHSYSVLNDWNQINPLVERQWEDCLTYWLTEYGVDGFRFDLVKGLGDNGSYGTRYDRATNSFATPSEAATNALNQSRIDRMKRLHEAVRAVRPDAIFINEDLAGAAEENLLGADGDLNWANVNNASCQFAMGYQDDSNMNRFYAPLDGGRTFGTTVSYAESHDEERMAYKQRQWAPASVKGSESVMMRRLGSVGAQMLMTPGAHMIWQFQELGDAQPVKQSDGNNNTSPRSTAWHLLDQPDHRDLMETYTALCAIRRKAPELFDGNAETEMHCAQSDWNAGRSIALRSAATGRALRLVVNPSVSSELTAQQPNGMSAVVASPGCDISSPAVRLAPGAFVIFSTDATLGAETIISDADHNSDGEAMTYDLLGRRIARPGQPGIYITRRGNRTVKSVVR